MAASSSTDQARDFSTHCASKVCTVCSPKTKIPSGHKTKFWFVTSHQPKFVLQRPSSEPFVSAQVLVQVPVASSTKTSSMTQVAIHWTPQTQRPLVWAPNVAWTLKVLQRPQGWTPKVALDWTPQRPFQSSLDWTQNVAIASTAERPFQRPLDW